MTVTDNYCHELPQNYPVANNFVWRKNALDFLDPIVKGVTTASGAVLAAPLGLGVGSMATGAAGAGAGYVAGDNLMDFAREVAGVPREKGSLPQELLYQTKNLAEGALTEIGGVALTKGLGQISKAIGDSKFATAWATSPYFRKAMTKLANEPKQINNPLIQQVVGKVSGKNAVESLKRAENGNVRVTEATLMEKNAITYFERIESKKPTVPFISFGKISQKTIADVKAETGIDIEGYKYVWQGSDLSHAIKEHGIYGKKIGHGQIPITKEDAPVISNIMNDYDFVFSSSTKGKHGNERIVFVKKSHKNTVVIVELRKEHKALAAKTIFKISDKNMTNETVKRVVNGQ